MEQRRRKFGAAQVLAFPVYSRRGRSRATSDVSRAYLTHAIHGRFAEPLATLAARICEGADPGCVARASTAALRVGQTSGRDGAFGLLLGLAAWSAPATTLHHLKVPVHG